MAVPKFIEGFLSLFLADSDYNAQLPGAGSLLFAGSAGVVGGILLAIAGFGSDRASESGLFFASVVSLILMAVSMLDADLLDAGKHPWILVRTLLRFFSFAFGLIFSVAILTAVLN